MTTETEQNMLKEIKEVEKYCPEEVTDGGKWNRLDVLKAKLSGYQLAQKEFKESLLMYKSNHQLGCMLECYQSIIENRIGFEKEAKQLLEIASKLK